jgi:hypothetical protein
VARGLMRWAERRARNRIRREWAEYQQPPEFKARWFRRDATQPRTQNFRSLVQVNFYRSPPR